MVKKFDKKIIVTYHKLIVTESFVSKKTYFMTKKGLQFLQFT